MSYDKSYDQPVVLRAQALGGNVDTILDIPPGMKMNIKYAALRAVGGAVGDGCVITVGDAAGGSEWFQWTVGDVPDGQTTKLENDNNAVQNMKQLNGGATGRSVFMRVAGGTGNANIYVGVGVY